MSPWTQRSMTGTVCADSGIRAQSSDKSDALSTPSRQQKVCWGRRPARFPGLQMRDSRHPTSTLRWSSLEAEGFGVGAHGGDAVGDVVVEGNVELGCAFDDVVAVDAASEGLVLHFLPHAGGVDIVDGLCGLDEGTGGEEAGELIAGEEGFGELGCARDAGVFGVAEDGGAYLFGPSLLGENGDADERMFFARGVLLVVEIVEECGSGPDFKQSVAIVANEAGGIGVELSVGTNAGFDSERVFEEAGGLRVLVEEQPGAFAGKRRLGHRTNLMYNASALFKRMSRASMAVSYVLSPTVREA
jgi:hypothetical protein